MSESTGPRRGALESLQRGILSTRANWQLILVVWVQSALAVVLGFLSLLPVLAVLDLELPSATATPDETFAWTVDAGTRLIEQLTRPAFWLALLSSTAILLALMACYSFFQAGAFGVLTLAERQAGRGPETGASGFRAFSWSRFQQAGGRHMWSYFWLLNILLALWGFWMLAAALAGSASALVATGAGPAAGIALGCASVFPLGFLMVLLLFWGFFGQAAISSRDVGAWGGLRVGLRIMLRRFGATLLLFVLLFVIAFAVALVFFVLSLPLSLALSGFAMAELFVTFLTQAFQWVFTAILQLVIVGAVVAIVRGEDILEARSAE